ncbi:MAG: glutaredoxin family protein [Acidobacteriia bacterium]|nr:glutaredoxin family protein [Terriglobia bacterium]
MIALTLYSRPGCHLCDDMKAIVDRVIRSMPVPITIDVVDISTDSALEARYGLEIPVLLVNGKRRRCESPRTSFDGRWQDEMAEG